MFRRLLFLSVGALVLLVGLGVPGPLHAQGMRGGFSNRMSPSFRGSVMPGFRGGVTPGLGARVLPSFRGGFDPRFNRGMFDPRFNPGFSPEFFGTF